MIFTVLQEVAERAREILENLGLSVVTESDCAKVAIVGAAITGIPGVMAKVVEALTVNGIEILQSGDSYTNIWCLVKRDQMEQAVKALHDKFDLGNQEEGILMVFPRLMTAMITPFNDYLEIDYTKVRELAQHLADTGSEGIVVCGTTGNPALKDEEKLKCFW